MALAITDRRLADFSTWLEERGRSDGTARVYTSHLRQCADTPALTSRLVDKALAPKTRRTSLAALAAWAWFTEDQALAKRLKEIRLPPSVRIKPKIPMTVEQWKVFVGAVKRDKKLDTPTRVVILIMALRGLRIGDCLRIQKHEVAHAVRTGKLSFEGKGRKRHELVATALAAELGDLNDLDGWTRLRDLFMNPGGLSGRRKIHHERAVDNFIARHVKRIAKKHKIDGMHPHRLRRTHATMYLDRLGNDPRAMIKLQNYMGWSNIATAASYVDAVDKAELDQVGADMVADLLE